MFKYNNKEINKEIESDVQIFVSGSSVNRIFLTNEGEFIEVHTSKGRVWVLHDEENDNFYPCTLEFSKYLDEMKFKYPASL